MTNEEYNRIKEQEKEYDSIYGYHIHVVTDNETGTVIENIHTHGLETTFGIHEFELVCRKPVSYKNVICDSYFNRKFIEMIKSLIKDGLVITGFGGDRKIIIKYTRIQDLESNTTVPVWRIIEADDEGMFPWDEGCNELYKIQWTEDDKYNREYHCIDITRIKGRQQR